MNPKPETRNPKLNILLIEDNPGDARLIKEVIEEADAAQFELMHVERLSEAIKSLKEDSFDAILLDLLLPDGTGFDAFAKAYTQAPQIPIIVLTGLDSEVLAMRTVRGGAQDYLVKGRIDSSSLVRSIRYAIQRHQLQSELRNLSLVDELTGLYNRRGFLTLAEQQLRLASRAEKGFLLAFADLDDLKQINDTFGHHEGDMALINTAAILKETFRNSDIIARIGGDEFVIVLIEAHNDDAEIIVRRLHANVESHNAKENRPYKLSISIGTAYYDPESPSFSIHEMLSRADTLMYAQKLNKKVRRVKSE
jgi:diguanylate cyclase (GGDEF) domain